MVVFVNYTWTGQQKSERDLWIEGANVAMTEKGPFLGAVKQIKEKSGVVEFLLDGRLQLARFVREGASLKGVPISLKTPLTDIVEVGWRCHVESVTKTTCIYEIQKGIFYTAYIDIIGPQGVITSNQPFTKVKETVITPSKILPEPDNKCFIQSRQSYNNINGKIIKLMNYKGAKIPRVVEVRIKDSVHHVFIHKAHVTFQGVKVSKLSPTRLPPCEVGMCVIVSGLEPYFANDCTRTGKAEIGVRQCPSLSSIMSTVSKPPETNQSALGAGSDGNEVLETTETLSVMGKVSKLITHEKRRVPRIVNAQIGGTFHRIFIHKSSVYLNGMQIKNVKPSEIPCCYTGTQVLVSNLQPYNANECTLRGIVHLESCHQSDKGGEPFPMMHFIPQEGQKFGLDYVSDPEWSPLRKRWDLPNVEQLQNSAAQFQSFVKNYPMMSENSRDSVSTDEQNIVLKPDIKTLSQTSSGSADGELFETNIAEQAKNLHESTHSLPAMELMPSPSSLPAKEKCNSEPIKKATSLMAMSSNQDMISHSFPSNSRIAENTSAFWELKAANTSNVIHSTQKTMSPVPPMKDPKEYYVLAEEFGQPVISTFSIEENSGKCTKEVSSPMNVDGDFLDIITKERIRSLNSKSRHFILEESPGNTSGGGGGRKKPIELQKLLDYCKSNLKMSKLPNLNPSHAGVRTVDQGTQTIATGDIIALGIYPGV